jgi:predicted nuclease of restriction endonuclease-like RecB superfamily
MLTSEQSIVEYRAGRAVPDRLTQSAHRHYLDHAEAMLSVYREGVGQERRTLHHRVEGIFTDEPDCPVRRVQAFCKLLDDRSAFATDPLGKASKLRLNVFARAACLHPLVQEPDRLFEHGEGQARSSEVCMRMSSRSRRSNGSRAIRMERHCYPATTSPSFRRPFTALRP